MIFCQGRPFDHCPDFAARLPRVWQEMTFKDGIGWLNYGPVECDDGLGRPHHGRNDDGSFGIPVSEVLCELFPCVTRPPARYYFPQGACFGTTSAAVRQYGRGFFRRMMSLGIDGWQVRPPGTTRPITWRENPTGRSGSWEMGLVYERLWAFLFGADLRRPVPWVRWAVAEGIEWDHSRPVVPDAGRP